MSDTPMTRPDALRAALTDLRERFLRLASQNGYGLYDPALHNQQIGRCSAFERAAQLVEAAIAHAAPTPEPPTPRDHNRCAVCGWPLDPRGEMCVRGNCSMRPIPGRFYDPPRVKVEYGEWAPKEADPYVPAPEPLDRAALLAAVEALPTFGNPFGGDLDYINRADVLRLLTGGTDEVSS